MSQTRPQLRILSWGSGRGAVGPEMLQRGFYIKNFGGETALGVQVILHVPTEIPDKWTSGGEGAAPSIAIDKDTTAFVPVWRELSRSFDRWDLPGYLDEFYGSTSRQGNQAITVTIRYSCDGKRYLTTQDFIYSPELRQVVGFGNPLQTTEDSEKQEETPSGLLTDSKQWWERPLGIFILGVFVAVVAGLIVWGITRRYDRPAENPSKSTESQSATAQSKGDNSPAGAINQQGNNNTGFVGNGNTVYVNPPKRQPPVLKQDSFDTAVPFLIKQYEASIPIDHNSNDPMCLTYSELSQIATIQLLVIPPAPGPPTIKELSDHDVESFLGHVFQYWTLRTIGGM